MPQTLATHIVELGRLRIGALVPIKGGKNAGNPRPTSLEKWRMTSNNHAALTIAATRYGGEVHPWQYPAEWLGLKQIRKPEQRFELFTETDTLNVILHGEGLMQTSFEQWEGPYCTRRCDGQFITKCGYGKLQGLECQCPSDPQERRRLAQDGKACEDVSRITVVLPGMPLGQWRLDTRGFYAPAEIRGLQYFLRSAEMGHTALEGTLRLERRVDQKMVDGTGQTFNYAVVVVEPKAPAEVLLLQGEARRQYFLAQGRQESQKQLSEHIADVAGDHDAVAAAREAARTSPPSLGEAILSPEEMATARYRQAAETEFLLRQIDDGLTALGQTSQQRVASKAKAARAHQQQHLADCLPSALEDVLQRIQARLAEKATDAPRPEPADAPPIEGAAPLPAADDGGEPDAPSGPLVAVWRAHLVQVAAVLDHDELAREASALAEDADATEAQGQALLGRITAHNEALLAQEGLPF